MCDADYIVIFVYQNQLADGSKRAFVSLLEYAEEELGVTHVIACLDRAQHNNKNVIRSVLVAINTSVSDINFLGLRL